MSPLSLNCIGETDELTDLEDLRPRQSRKDGGRNNPADPIRKDRSRYEEEDGQDASGRDYWHGHNRRNTREETERDERKPWKAEYGENRGRERNPQRELNELDLFWRRKAGNGRYRSDRIGEDDRGGGASTSRDGIRVRGARTPEHRRTSQEDDGSPTGLTPVVRKRGTERNANSRSPGSSYESQTGLTPVERKRGTERNAKSRSPGPHRKRERYIPKERSPEERGEEWKARDNKGSEESAKDREKAERDERAKVLKEYRENPETAEDADELARMHDYSWHDDEEEEMSGELSAQRKEYEDRMKKMGARMNKTWQMKLNEADRKHEKSMREVTEDCKERLAKEKQYWEERVDSLNNTVKGLQAKVDTMTEDLIEARNERRRDQLSQELARVWKEEKRFKGGGSLEGAEHQKETPGEGEVQAVPFREDKGRDNSILEITLPLSTQEGRPSGGKREKGKAEKGKTRSESRLLPPERAQTQSVRTRSARNTPVREERKEDRGDGKGQPEGDLVDYEGEGGESDRDK